jgi:hypothetical protein
VLEERGDEDAAEACEAEVGRAALGGLSIVRRTFVVTVFADDHTVVVEDVRSGRRERVEDLAHVGARIEEWLEEQPLAAVHPLGPGGPE